MRWLFWLSHSRTLKTEMWGERMAPVARFLCRPIFPPSGVSSGQMKPHCDVCRRRGAMTLEVESRSMLVLRICEMSELNERRSSPWATPSIFVCILEPQFPLNPFSMPSWTMRLEKRFE